MDVNDKHAEMLARYGISPEQLRTHSRPRGSDLPADNWRNIHVPLRMDSVFATFFSHKMAEHSILHRGRSLEARSALLCWAASELQNKRVKGVSISALTL